MTKIRHIKIIPKVLNEWRNKYWKELDIFVFGNAYEDEKGNRIDPMNVLVKHEKVLSPNTKIKYILREYDSNKIIFPPKIYIEK